MYIIFVVLSYVLGFISCCFGVIGALIDNQNDNGTTCAATKICNKLLDAQEAIDKKKNGEEDNDYAPDFSANYNYYNRHDSYDYNVNEMYYDEDDTCTFRSKIIRVFTIIKGFVKYTIIAIIGLAILFGLAYVVVNLRQPIDPSNLVPTVLG